MRVLMTSHGRQGWSLPLDAALDSSSTLVLVFAAPEYVELPAPVEELRHAFPRATLLGCSTAGEIFGGEVNDNSISAMVLRFERSTLRLAVRPIPDAAASREAAHALGRELDAPDLRAVLVLSDGLSVNGTGLVRGFAEVLRPGVVVTGGLAGDGDRFRRTWVLSGAEIGSGRVAAVGLYGAALRVGHGSKGGWDLFGPERVVTRSRGNVLYELDGKPALQLYKDYLGERASGLPSTALLFPLALRAGRARQVVRTVLGVDEATQSMTFAGDIPEGALAQLMHANFERIVQGASDAALEAAASGDGPVASIAVSCVGRRLLLGSRIEEETEATLEVLPPSTSQVGFYSYGEIGPNSDGRCELHNQTMTLTTISESA
jgi:hypothetical protein